MFHWIYIGYRVIYQPQLTSMHQTIYRNISEISTSLSLLYTYKNHSSLLGGWQDDTYKYGPVSCWRGCCDNNNNDDEDATPTATAICICSRRHRFYIWAEWTRPMCGVAIDGSVWLHFIVIPYIVKYYVEKTRVPAEYIFVGCFGRNNHSQVYDFVDLWVLPTLDLIEGVLKCSISRCMIVQNG